MRITFFIGNGFDLNMGFKTGYDSFYSSLSGDKLDNPIVKSITHDKELWSDMEEGLGNYYNSEVAKNDDYFIEAKHQIELYLEEYLDKVQKQAVYTDTNRISLEMKKSIVDFYKPLNRKCREDIIRIIKGIREQIDYSFIVFNYTSIFDNCIEVMRKDVSHSISTHTANGIGYNDNLGTVHHVNGIIGDGIVLGIDNCEQTQCRDMNNDSYVADYIIKSKMNDIYGQMRTEDAQRMLNESQIICIYGMALGKTDKMWWKKIAEWLDGNTNRRLIIYTYKNEGHRNDIYTEIKCRQGTLEKFKAVSEVNDEKWKVIQERIFTKENPSLFNFNLCHTTVD